MESDDRKKVISEMSVKWCSFERKHKNNQRRELVTDKHKNRKEKKKTR